MHVKTGCAGCPECQPEKYQKVKTDDEYVKMARKYLDREEWRYRFAGQALQSTCLTLNANMVRSIAADSRNSFLNEIATACVKMADALLDELEGKG